MRDLSPGEQLAGFGGLALILIMFLFAWYSLGIPGVNGLDAFDAFDDWVNIILVFTAFSGMCLGLFGGGLARTAVSLSVVTAVLGVISSVLLVIFLISPPGVPGLGEAVVEVSLDREPGVWLGLIAAIAVAIGGYKAMQEEGVTFGDAADRLSSAPGAGAPPSAQPPSSATPPPPPPPSSPPPPPQG
jgi:hypothetical protein